MSFKFGLNVKNKLGNGPNKPAPGKRKAFLDDDDEEVKGKSKGTKGEEEIGEFNFEDRAAPAPEPAKPVSSKQKAKPTGPPSRKPKGKEDDPSVLGNAASIQESERRAKEATEIDAAIYDYDAAYDALHAGRAAKKAAEQEDAAQRRPKYMETLFESAEQRKKDQLRARDKVLQREREAEGDEFADKEKFVTSAYKAQQEETRKAEEEEKKKQELEEERRRKQGMQGFHKHMLMEEEKRHAETQAAMEAAIQAAKESGTKPVVEEPKEKSDAEIARELNAQGKNIILNEDGQVADKRQLLNAGLNIVAKPKPVAVAQSSSARPGGAQNSYQGRNANKQAVRERQTAMVVEQIEQAAKRKADEEAEEQRKLEHANKSRKTQSDIMSAKEKYLQRKKEREAAKAAAGK
jgi:hypothetical protein